MTKNEQTTYHKRKSAEHYQRVKGTPEFLAKNRTYQNKLRARRRSVILALKMAPCTDCGNKFPPECMDFDHVRGEKKFQISTWGMYVKPMTILKAELAKCELVCSNCHRIRTHIRRQQVTK